MKKNWHRGTAGVLSGLALTFVLAGCESKKDEPAQIPADSPRSMAEPSERRDAPIAPAPPAQDRPGAVGKE
jgi:hypothetical protein